ncbi:MAG: rhodanese-like domain-containing protein [Proteobacteria bacterium]|jgi:rhodanese-related sulfurtransferase|nr:rhodanese-like domain-containing protein [Desulfocapsa sp.]MBU3944853.1 rhodanese-like domain-containing protein [Pseudomonadota bacterium]MCG2744033.1 rhodanese-like domain-containing protein [Desulfobacteraceae bacterium]MDO8945829.1 rhodanese-like domain-containing protein [Desulfocapsaceae bacterium]MBU3982631.1 rhodanese-like domain-containing protein [Pseudomonadota bacterium]
MITVSLKRIVVGLIAGCLLLSLQAGPGLAQEVDKGKIPADQLAASFKQLAWGSPVWDVDEAVAQLKSDAKVLWVDTRPESFYKTGSVQGAILLPYDKQGVAGNVLSQETLDKAVIDAGLSKDSAKVIFFCQGPKCHRSYNAAFMAVSAWGYKPENSIWFRAGYPFLFKAVQDDVKLKRKANKYLSEAGIKQL